MEATFYRYWPDVEGSQDVKVSAFTLICQGSLTCTAFLK